jgi:hypothetical protein
MHGCVMRRSGWGRLTSPSPAAGTTPVSGFLLVFHWMRLATTQHYGLLLSTVVAVVGALVLVRYTCGRIERRAALLRGDADGGEHTETRTARDARRGDPECPGGGGDWHEW